jgi:predicted GIY-YIG superfamily endonuclease
MTKSEALKLEYRIKQLPADKKIAVLTVFLSDQTNLLRIKRIKDKREVV